MSGRSGLFSTLTLVLLVLGLAGCGNQSDRATLDSAGSPSTRAADRAETSATEPADEIDERIEDSEAPEGSGDASEGQSGDGARDESNGDTSEAPAPDAAPQEPLVASVARPCVKGGEEQTLRVQGVAGSHVRYFTLYSDGNSSHSPDYYGGDGEGTIGDDGIFEASWVVAPNAAEGQAVVGVWATTADESSQSGHASFDVADELGVCPPRTPWPG